MIARFRFAFLLAILPRIRGQCSSDDERAYIPVKVSCPHLNSSVGWDVSQWSNVYVIHFLALCSGVLFMGALRVSSPKQ